MQPDLNLVTINDNKKLIHEFINDLIIKPRISIHKWSLITKQTPTLKIGYIGQHLASLIIGMEGDRTGARGHDIIDGTEVKSCTKVDQVDSCKDCKGRVMRSENLCSHCGSSEIFRKNDSKWLFSIRTIDELHQLTIHINRVFLLISDYPYFKQNDFTTVRFEAFEIYPKNPRMSIFSDLLTNYYHDNYKKKAENNKLTAPMNFHPYSYQFYICNPIKVFSCIIDNIDSSNSVINIQKYVLPNANRSNLTSENMPIELLQKKELLSFIQNTPFKKVIKPLLLDQSLNQKQLIEKIKKCKKAAWKNSLPYIDELGKTYLSLRSIKIRPNKTNYKRN